MGNVIGSFFSGFAKVVGDILGNPLDFLSGKSCNSVCGSTWDIVCYIENFCVAHLLKMAMVLVLLYIVLLFLYLLHKLGICECVCWSLCRMLWACFASCLSACDCCCTFLCHKLCLQRRMRRRRRHRQRKVDIEVFDTSSTEAEEDYGNVEASFTLRDHDYDLYKEKSGPSSGRRRDYRGDQLRKSLRPRNHRIGAGISRDLGRHGSRRSSIKRNHDHDHNSRVDHGIRVTRTSKFVRKGTIYTGGVLRRRNRTMGG